jgi:hypothetical protein
MRTYGVGDAWTEACLLRAEEALEEARARAVRRALLQAARPPRRTPRVWLGSVLLAVGHRLLQPAAGDDEAPALVAATAARDASPARTANYPRGN